MKVGVAPAQGLYLDMSFYNGYNQRKNIRQGRGAPQLPDLDWSGDSSRSNSNAAAAAAGSNVNDDKSNKTSDVLEAAETSAVSRWKEFRNGTVMKHVVAQELQDGNFIKHLYIQEFAVDVVKDYRIEQQQPQSEQAPPEEAAAVKKDSRL